MEVAGHKNSYKQYKGPIFYLTLPSCFWWLYLKLNSSPGILRVENKNKKDFVLF